MLFENFMAENVFAWGGKSSDSQKLEETFFSHISLQADYFYFVGSAISGWHLCRCPRHYYFFFGHSLLLLACKTDHPNSKDLLNKPEKSPQLTSWKRELGARYPRLDQGSRNFPRSSHPLPASIWLTMSMSYEPIEEAQQGDRGRCQKQFHKITE